MLPDSVCSSRELMIACLTQALPGLQVVRAACRACEASGINALVLARGTMSVTDVARCMYLTYNEAALVVDICKLEVHKQLNGLAGLAGGASVSVVPSLPSCTLSRLQRPLILAYIPTAPVLPPACHQ